MHRVSCRSFLVAALIGSASLLPFYASASGFDPDAGAEALATASTTPLPDPALLHSGAASAASTPPSYVSPLLPLALPPQPLYPHKALTARPPAVASEAEFPPVSSEVEQAAKALITPPATAIEPVASSGTIAPIPTLDLPPPPAALTANDTPVALPQYTPPAVAAASKVEPAPIAPAPVAANSDLVPVDVAAPLTIAPPATKLSTQTKEILGTIPSAMGAPAKAGKQTKLAVDRVSPEINAILGADVKEDQFESVGLSIKVRRPGLDANYELNRAYTALMGGDTSQAIAIYKDILSTDAKNEDALFGLAATHHRQGQLDKARPLYGALLKLNPNHREGLNNFLALVSDESPQDALPELERLEERNPDFSPIPAQTAIVLDTLGYKDLAREKMLRAIELAPDNLAYKYNLAVMLDRQGRYSDAGALYKLLIKAALQGEPVPATVQTMQKRLNYITTTASERKALGS